MKEKIKKYLPNISKYTLLFTLIMMALSVLFLAKISNDDDIQFHLTEKKLLDVPWVYNQTQTISFPTRLQLDSKKTLELSCTLPETIEDNTALFYDCSYCTQEVYIDHKLVYSYAQTPPLPFGNLCGNAYALIPLSEEYAGKELSIQMTNPFGNTSSNFLGVFYGLEGEFKFSLFLENLWRLGLYIIFLVIAIASFCVGLYHKFNHQDANRDDAPIYFALLTISVGNWLMSDSAIMQFLTNELTVVQFMSFTCLIFIGSFYMGLCSNLFYHSKTLFHMIEIFGYFLWILMFLLYIGNIKDPVKFMYYIYCYALLCLLSSCIVQIKQKEQYTHSKAILTGSVILFLGVLLSIALFLTNPMQSYAAKAFSLSFTFYIIFLFIIVVKSEVSIIKIAASTSMYRHLAYTDYLTELPNRAAFERDFDLLHNNEISASYITLYIFDVNNLKIVNDNKGHEAGDALIKKAAFCIRETFHEKAQCYRIGGDEFAVLQTSTEKNVAKESLEQLQHNMNKVNRHAPQQLSMAVGYEVAPLPLTSSSSKNFLFKNADAAMYRNKEEYKNKY